MRLPFTHDPADEPLTGPEQKRLFISFIERLASMEDSITKLTNVVAGLETDFAAALARAQAAHAAALVQQQAAHAAELAGRQADVDAITARVEALRAQVAGLDADTPDTTPNSLAADAVGCAA